MTDTSSDTDFVQLEHEREALRSKLRDPNIVLSMKEREDMTVELIAITARLRRGAAGPKRAPKPRATAKAKVVPTEEFD